ncbi:RGS domain-containing protein [Plasmodiophora brassicae]
MNTYDLAAATTLIASLVVDAVVFVPLIVLFIRRRHVHPIQSRQAFVVVFEQGVYRVACLLDMCSAVFRSREQVTSFIVDVLLTVTMECLVIRCVWLVWRVDICRRQIALQDGGVSPQHRDVVLRYQHLCTNRTQAICMATMAFVHVAITGVAAAAGTDPALHKLIALLYNVLLIVNVIIIVTFRMRFVRDAFWIKWELVCLTRGVLCSIVLGVMLLQIPLLYDNVAAKLPMAQISEGVLSWYGIYLSLYLPIRWSYAKVQSGIVHTLKDVIASDTASAALQAYLETEFCAETVMFLRAVHKFRLLAEKESETVIGGAVSLDVQTPVASEARRIYDMFIRLGSPVEINLSDDIRKRYDAFFASTPSTHVTVVPRDKSAPASPARGVADTFFSEPSFEVECMLNGGPFSRFLQSPVAQEVLRFG